MCGILGWNKRNAKFSDNEINLFKDSLELLDSRGPDHTGFVMNYDTLIGHKRLKILDITDKSNQPYSKIKGKTLVYNGEIYNYRELENLYVKDSNFYKKETLSDTQVVYECLLKFKENSLNLFDGMFAFAWHDEDQNSILIARDCLGQKPLYFYHDENETLYSSELSSILAIKKNLQLCRNNFSKYLKNGYYPGENTPFKKVYKLLPGHYLNIQNGKLRKIKYWQNIPLKDSLSDEFEEEKVTNIFIEKFLRSCEKTYKADVPVGIFLSGGIDSSLVYKGYKNLGINIQTFTVGFKDNDYDESKKAKKLIANLSEYNELIIDSNDVFDGLEYISSLIDEPHGDPGFINAFLLTKFAKEKITVGLTGDGADELFGGYETFHAQSIYRKIKFTPTFGFKLLNKIVNSLPESDGYMNNVFKLKRFLNGADKKGLLCYINWLGCENNLLLSKLFSKDKMRKYILSNKLDYDVLKNCDLDDEEILKDDFDALLNFYQKNFLPGFVCQHTDRASMMNSLEVRSPFLNKEIIEFANSLNKKYKYKNNQTKYILRRALEKLGGSSELVSRKKMGFTMPLARWQRLYFSEKIKKIPQKIEECTEGMLDHKKVDTLIKDHLTGKKNHYQIIHSMMIFISWRERNINYNFE